MQSQFELLTAQVLKLTSDEVLAAEVERRNSDIENGKTQVIPIDEALAQVRAGLGPRVSSRTTTRTTDSR